MNKICTDIPQSKKLIELGVDVDTSDMVYLRSYFEDEGEYNLLVGSYHEGYMEKDDGTIIPVFDEHIPAWSLSALLGLMPFHIIENNRFSFYQVKGFNKQGETYRFGYKTNDNSFLFETSWHNNAIDAAFEMICWLKENNKI